MFKVLLVDDENFIRRGMKNIIKWEDYNCEVCGEASDGIEGIEKIKELQPEIIITDIRMPGIDGLEMIKQTKEILPNSKIIILTAYRDFDYLKEALVLGAFDYILKPTQIDEFNPILERASEELKKELLNKKNIADMKENLDNYMPILKQKLLYDLMFNIHDNEEDILKALKAFNLVMDNFLLIFADIPKQQNVDNNIEEQNMQTEIINTFENIFSVYFNIINIKINRHQIAFIIIPTKDFNFSDTAYEKTISFQETMEKCFNLKVNTAISTLCSSIFELSDKTKECLYELNYRDSIVKESNILDENLIDINTLSFSNDNEYFNKLLFNAVKIGKSYKIRNSLEEVNAFINCCNKNISEIKLFYFNIIKNLYSSIEFNDTIHISSFNYTEENIKESINKCTTIQDLQIIFSDIMSAFLPTASNFSTPLQKAIEYINNNYSKPITLIEVAQSSYVSSSYLSRLFPKHLGNNFIDYLSDVRIEYSKKYLRESNYKTYEIADIVGIRDAHYFSKLFKKYTGLTPSEYKNIFAGKIS
ncbi:MAG: response regulator [Bacillota bacterium]|nr:response regulator [Bacillota bacterium]